MAKICSSHNLSALEQINIRLKKGILFLELVSDNYFSGDTDSDISEALFFDALENMKSFVSSVSQFEECLRSEKNIDI